MAETPWQKLILDLCDPAKQPHPFLNAPLALAKAINEALAHESLCLCYRCPEEVLSDDPYEHTACRDCAAGRHIS